MLTKDKLNRINELARKSKAEGLSVKEQKEQKSLRAEYLQNVRKSFKNQLKSTKIVDEEGTDVTPQKLKDEKERAKKGFH
ncbi:DUF896 domain-containing protein [Salisediminibacterium beveridgei]|uniref:UPF0291 protein BBEV_1737 n=1 Tax=Salisediminibacterium beveridgei TaxID=632773 RepID=A0A1D7QVV5_9BACI|nr:DUF896 domain-containing protein [Salisediminibacterium beveridgei]AOM83098.1 hypothetical protein BBEV_1737 [Salisediminibacterium beveridgei]